MSTYAYARISKDHDKSVSVENQVRRIRAFAEATDRDIDRLFVDRDASGRSLERPSMMQLREALKPGDTIIVFKLDRLTRSVRDLAEMLDKGYQLVSVSESLDTQSASGRLVVNILGVVAQWEREVTAERTTQSLGYKRGANQVYGAVPYGYKREGDALVSSEIEGPALEYLRRMLPYAGVTQTARLLNERFPDACRGAQWYPATVSSIAHSLKYGDDNTEV